MNTETTTEAVAKKDIQKLQRAIVDGLEDVKAQDIQVFDTTHLSPLFERVIVASGTSNRQTKALASSVRDAVREAGFAKPRTEGEDNGEWIIVDCGQAVAHIMQPAIRQYYHLEDLWGDKPVRLKHGAEKVKAEAPKKEAEPKKAKKTGTAKVKAEKGEGKALEAPAKKAAKPTVKKIVGKAPAKKAAAKKSAAKKAAPKVVKVNDPKKVAKKPAAKKPAARKSAR
jgi:ribosome-associated protein